MWAPYSEPKRDITKPERQSADVSRNLQGPYATAPTCERTILQTFSSCPGQGKPIQLPSCTCVESRQAHQKVLATGAIRNLNQTIIEAPCSLHNHFGQLLAKHLPKHCNTPAHVTHAQVSTEDLLRFSRKGIFQRVAPSASQRTRSGVPRPYTCTPLRHVNVNVNVGLRSWKT